MQRYIVPLVPLVPRGPVHEVEVGEVACLTSRESHLTTSVANSVGVRAYARACARAARRYAAPNTSSTTGDDDDGGNRGDDVPRVVVRVTCYVTEPRVVDRYAAGKFLRPDLPLLPFSIRPSASFSTLIESRLRVPCRRLIPRSHLARSAGRDSARRIPWSLKSVTQGLFTGHSRVGRSISKPGSEKTLGPVAENRRTRGVGRRFPRVYSRLSEGSRYRE